MTSTPAVAVATSISGAVPAVPAAIHGRSPWQLAWARLRRDKCDCQGMPCRIPIDILPTGSVAIYSGI